MLTAAKRISCLFLAISCLFLLAACGGEKIDPARKFELYYINNAGTGVELHDYEMQSDTAQDQINEILERLGTLPGKLEYKAPMNMGFTLLGYRLENEILTLDVDTAYKAMPFTTEILVRAALVCSLTQINGVSYVEITVEGSPLFDNLNVLVGRMTAAQFINNTGSEINTYEVADLTLYFANEAGDGLIPVKRRQAYSTNIPLDRLIVEQVLAGPDQNVDGKVFPAVNPGVQIVSVRTRDGICYVNLSDAFLSQIYNVTADVTIYSIVNSLTELNTVNKVQISINGDTGGTYREKFSFNTMFERNLDIVVSSK